MPPLLPGFAGNRKGWQGYHPAGADAVSHPQRGYYTISMPPLLPGFAGNRKGWQGYRPAGADAVSHPQRGYYTISMPPLLPGFAGNRKGWQGYRPAGADAVSKSARGCGKHTGLLRQDGTPEAASPRERGKGSVNILIVGDGKVGSALAEQLSQEDHNVTVIDSDPKVVEESVERLDVMAVVGNGASMATLREAGAETADLLIAATSQDELNLLTCLTAKRLGCSHTIARIRNPEYTDQLVNMGGELGLSLTVNPEQDAALEAYRLLQFPSVLKRESFAKGRVEIVAVPVEPGSRLAGLPLRQLYEIARVKVLVCAVERGGQVHIPSGSFVLQAGDTIFVTAGVQDLAQLVRNLGFVAQKVRSLLIIGGSRIAFYLAARCLDSGISVKIIERDHARCLALAERLPGATVIEADGSRQEVLDAEGILGFDAAITLTGMDEENVVLSMFAQRLGVGKIITKINRLEYDKMFRQMGIGSIISPKALRCANIARYVRAMSTARGSEELLTLHPIAEGQAEALEFQAGPSTRHCGEPLRDIPLKDGILIACITHQGRTLIPRGDASFSPGDTVIVVTAGGRTITALDGIFAD